MAFNLQEEGKSSFSEVDDEFDDKVSKFTPYVGILVWVSYQNFPIRALRRYYDPFV